MVDDGNDGRWRSGKATEVLHSHLDNLFGIGLGSLEVLISPHDEAMDLVGELLTAHLIGPELLLQDLDVLSSLLGPWLVIAAGVEKDGTPHRLHQFHLISSVEVLDVQGRMHSDYGTDVIVVGR
jgi:hypothetical protein